MEPTSSPAFHDSLETIFSPLIQGFMRDMKHNGLSMPQIHALMYIYHADNCQVSDIAALAGVSNAAASQLVERLVQAGFVERREDPENRRVKILRLSEKGQRLIQESLSANHLLVELMASLTPEQHKTVHAAIAILSQAADRIRIGNRKDGDHA